MSAYGFDALTGGGSDALDAITGYVDGDIAIGVVGGLYLVYQLDSNSAATEDGDLVIAPDDVGAGNARWIKMVPGGAMSHVRAKGATTSIPSTSYTKVINPTIDLDILAEYNATTGIFTPIYSGYYRISFSFQLAGTSYSAGKIVLGKLAINSNDILKFNRWICQAAGSYVIGKDICCGVHYVSAGQGIELYVYQDSGAAVNLTGDVYYNHFSINRII